MGQPLRSPSVGLGPMTAMDHDDRGGVGVYRLFQITAEVAHHVASFACTEFIVVEHGHGSIDHDEP